MAQEEIASNCHHHMVAEPLIAYNTARTFASERRRIALDSCRGNSRVGCGKVAKALYLVFAILACVLRQRPTVPTALVDTRLLGKPGTFSGALAEWKPWRFTFTAYAKALRPDMKRLTE